MSHQDHCPEPTLLYRYFDADGALLYVGITVEFADRDIAHQKKARWRRDAGFVRLEMFPTRRLAEIAEDHAIAVEGPLENLKAMSQPDPDNPRNRWFLEKMGGLRGELVGWFGLGQSPHECDPPAWWDDARLFHLPYPAP